MDEISILIEAEETAPATVALYSSHVRRGGTVSFYSENSSPVEVDFGERSPFDEERVFTLNPGQELDKEVSLRADVNQPYKFMVRAEGSAEEYRIVVAAAEPEADPPPKKRIGFLFGENNASYHVYVAQRASLNVTVVNSTVSPQRVRLKPHLSLVRSETLTHQGDNTSQTIEMTAQGPALTVWLPDRMDGGKFQGGGTAQVEIIVDPEDLGGGDD